MEMKLSITNPDEDFAKFELFAEPTQSGIALGFDSRMLSRHEYPVRWLDRWEIEASMMHWRFVFRQK
jgi:hypothetical protein